MDNQLTCDRSQGTKQLDQCQHKRNSKIAREGEEEGVTVCCHRVLREKGTLLQRPEIFTVLTVQPTKYIFSLGGGGV